MEEKFSALKFQKLLQENDMEMKWDSCALTCEFYIPPLKNLRCNIVSWKECALKKSIKENEILFLFLPHFFFAPSAQHFHANNFQSNKIQYFMRWCLEYALVGNHFQEYYSIRLPKKRRKWILHEDFHVLPISIPSLSTSPKNFSCWILFHEASGDAQGERGKSKQKKKQIKEIVV